MNTAGPVRLLQLSRPDQVPPGLRDQLADCWAEVSDHGGAVGFLPPADRVLVAEAVTRLLADLDLVRCRVVYAVAEEPRPGAGRPEGILAGWLAVRRDTSPLIAHWGTVQYVQVHPAFGGRGVGSALMRRVRQVAREEMGLEQLRLALRSGRGLEHFYGRLGWRVVGGWPGALRVAPGEDRDEILMLLAPL